MSEIEELVKKLLIGEIKEEELTQEQVKDIYKYLDEENKKIEKESKELKKNTAKNLKELKKYEKGIKILEDAMNKED